jgi:hypothetical protein
MPNRWLLIASLASLLAADLDAAEAQEPVEVIVVTGRQPGPPLWRVINGDNVLYIFPTLSPVPEGMEWESGRVERVLEESQEAFLAPDVDADFSKRILFNPINLVRGPRLFNRLSANPDDATLDKVLPPELYARYHALKIKYFPRDDEPEEIRPLFAAGSLAGRILREEGLNSGDGIRKELERLMRRSRDLVRTDIEVTVDLTGSFKELAARMEAFVASLSREQELECFTQVIGRLETDLEAMKSRANAWARGRIDEFRGIPLPGDVNDACNVVLFESSEHETLEQLKAELDRRWIEAAERALGANKSTFAVLDITELLREDGLLAELEMRGYEVREPQ